MPLASKISSASNVVGLLAPSTIILQSRRSALSSWSIPPSAAGTKTSQGIS